MMRIITKTLLTSLVIGFSAIGADKPKSEFDKQGNLVTDIGKPTHSRTGLEGWGKNGVRIIVYDYSKLDKNFPLKAIETRVELRLRQADIKVVDKYTGDQIMALFGAKHASEVDTQRSINTGLDMLAKLEYRLDDNSISNDTYQ